MGKRIISRKEFLIKASAGIAGLSLVGTGTKNNIINPVPVRKPSILCPLGNSGIMVSRLCFEASLPGNAKLLEHAIENGVNFIDTARTYGNGNNEKIVGSVISGIRNEIVISTKIRLGHEELKSEMRGKRLFSEIRSVLQKKSEESLAALKTDYIDVLLIHDASDENLLFSDSVLNFFSDMKRSGVVRAFGFSANEAYSKLTERNNRESFFDVVMIPFNCENINNRIQQEESESTLSAASGKGTGIIAMKVTGRNATSDKDESTGINDLKCVLGHEFISSAVIVTDESGKLDEYLNLL
jgi:aryl-alcohol dehydrogenase-like predicted oxidoreductase